jgi:hypothetical protein
MKLTEHTPEVPNSPWRTALCYLFGPLYGLIGAMDDIGGIVGFVLGALAMAVFAMWMLG